MAGMAGNRQGMAGRGGAMAGGATEDVEEDDERDENGEGYSDDDPEGESSEDDENGEGEEGEGDPDDENGEEVEKGFGDDVAVLDGDELLDAVGDHIETFVRPDLETIMAGQTVQGEQIETLIKDIGDLKDGILTIAKALEAGDSSLLKGLTGGAAPAKPNPQAARTPDEADRIARTTVKRKPVVLEKGDPAGDKPEKPSGKPRDVLKLIEYAREAADRGEAIDGLSESFFSDVAYRNVKPGDLDAIEKAMTA